MNSKLIKIHLFLFIFMIYQILFISFKNFYEYKKFYYLIFSMLSIFQGLFLRNILKTLKIKKEIIIFLKLDKVLYLFQLNYIFSYYFYDQNYIKINFSIFIFLISDLIRIYIILLLTEIFFDNDNYKKYKYIIELEKFYIKTFNPNHKDYSENFILNHINSNKERIKADVIFNEWSDNNNNNIDINNNNNIDINNNNIDINNNNNNNNSIDINNNNIDINNNNIDDNNIDYNNDLINSNNKIEKFLSNDNFNKLITFKSLNKIFSEPEAKQLLNIITKKLSSKLNYLEFYDNMRQFNNDRTFITKMAKSNLKIKKILEYIGITIEILFLFLIFSLLNTITQNLTFDAFLKSYIIPLTILPFFYTLFNPFLSLIYHKSFFVGDRIHIFYENSYDNLIVQEINLTHTVFERWNNEFVIITNDFLVYKVINNIRKSNNQMWKISFYTSNKSRYLTGIKVLEKYIQKQESFESVTMALEEIKNNKFILVSFIIKHCTNFQNGFFMWQFQNKFMKKLVEICHKTKIKFYPQSVKIEII